MRGVTNRTATTWATAVAAAVTASAGTPGHDSVDRKTTHATSAEHPAATVALRKGRIVTETLVRRLHAVTPQRTIVAKSATRTKPQATPVSPYLTATAVVPTVRL